MMIRVGVTVARLGFIVGIGFEPKLSAAARIGAVVMPVMLVLVTTAVARIKR